MKKMRSDYYKGRLKFLPPLLMILCIASGYFTFRGMSLLADANGVDFDGRASATVFAIASSCAIYLFWTFAMGFVPEERTKKKQAIGLAIILGGIPFIIALSSWSNVAGIAGEPALDTHVQKSVQRFETAFANQYEQGRAIQSLLPDLKLEISRYEQAAKDEFSLGTYSGRPGPGAVQKALTGIAGRLEGLRGIVTRHLDRTKELSTQAKQQLEKMRNVAGREVSPAERMKLMSKHGDALRGLLTDMDGRRLAQSVIRIMNGLSQEAAIPVKFSRNPKIAKDQQAALDRLNEDITRSAGILSEFAASIAALPPVQSPPLERVSAMRAVALHALDYLPAWIGGIAIDIAPLAVILFVMLSVSTEDDANETADAIKNTTLIEMLHAKVGEELLRRVRLEEERLNRLSDRCFGEDKRDDEKDNSNR